jgi:hypothetical protein
MTRTLSLLDLSYVVVDAEVVGNKPGNGSRRCAMRQTQILRRPRRPAPVEDLPAVVIVSPMDTSAAAALVETIDTLVEG